MKNKDSIEEKKESKDLKEESFLEIWKKLCDGVSSLFPKISIPTEPKWKYFPLLILIAFILRAIVALVGNFVVHPDEVMQYLEPAHGIVFGNTISYWEHFYGGRSMLVPYFIAPVLYLCKGLGLGTPEYYIPAVKLLMCTLSLLIPISLYEVGRKMFSEAAGRIALLFGVFWYEFVGFAGTSMTEFIGASLVCGLLLLVIQPKLTMQKIVFTGILSILIIAVRLQYGLLVGVIWILIFFKINNYGRILLFFTSLLSVVAVGLFDMATWDYFLQSYWVYFKTNITMNPLRFQEQASIWRYLGWPIVASGGLFLVALISMWNYKRRLFLILLTVALILPHLTQVHREYRFIFVLIPIWILLCADWFTVQWKKIEGEDLFVTVLKQNRKNILLAYAFLVSILGISNNLPKQDWVYQRFSNETKFLRFLRGQDKVLDLYQGLSKDSSVKGIKDANRPYFNTGGYFYLHQNVPFYDNAIQLPTPEKPQNFVSHLITAPFETPKQVGKTPQDKWAMITDKQSFLLPHYISDALLKKLVYWNENGESIILEDFEMVEESDQFVLWRKKEDTPVYTWKNSIVYPDAEFIYPIVKEAVGEYAKDPSVIKNYGIEFVGTIEEEVSLDK